MDKSTINELREELFNNVYSAYLTARKLQGSPNHPIISGLRAYLITHFAQRGRRAVEEANRAILNAQKQEARETLPKLKRLQSPGGKRPARPLGELPPALQMPPMPQMPEENPPHPVEGPAVAADAPPADVSADILSEDEKAELLTMTPRAAGSHFGADRLRATMLHAGQDAPEDMKQTQAAAALIAFLKK